MKKLTWLISPGLLVTAAVSLGALGTPAEGRLLPVMPADAVLFAAVAGFIFRKPYASQHRAPIVDKPELGVAVAPGEESISLIEHLSARVPGALESADIQALHEAALQYVAARLPATDMLLLDIADENVNVRLARGRVRTYVGKRFQISETVKSRLDEDMVLAFPDLRALSYDDMRGEFPAILFETRIRALSLAKTFESGVLAVASTRRAAFSPDDVAFLASVSAQLNYVCRAQKRLAATGIELEERARLMGFVDDLALRHEAAPVIDEALAWAVNVLGAATGSIMVVDRQQGELNPVAAIGLDERERLAALKVGEGIVGWVAKSKKPIVVEAVPDNGPAESGANVGYTVYFPALVLGEVWAVISLAFSPAAPRFDQKSLAKVRRTIERIMSLTEPFSSALDIWSTHIATIKALVELSESRDRWRRGHTGRVWELAAAAGRALKLDRDNLRALQIASLVHAFGYLAVDRELLDAGRALDPRELAHVRGHAAITADSLSVAPNMDEVIPIVRQHHEHYDGSGYNGLSGDQIPFGARILAVADAYEAMISPRPYRPAMSRDQAVRELNRQAGADFDPQVVGVVSEIVRM